MNRLYRVYRSDYEGEYTEGYIQLDEEKLEKLESISDKLEGSIGEFIVEEIKVDLNYENLLKEKQEELKRREKYLEERNKDEFYSTQMDILAEWFSKESEALDKEYKDHGSVEYKMRELALMSEFTNNMRMIELSYVSSQAFNNAFSKEDDDDKE